MGLAKVESLPVGSGWFDLGAGYSTSVGLEGYAEAGYRAKEWLSVFGRASVYNNNIGVMLGARGTF